MTALEPITGKVASLRDEDAAPPTPHAIVRPTAAHADRPSLTMLRGPGRGTTFTLERTMTLVGRGEMADIVLDEPSVSRAHARISLGSDGVCSIEDLGSTNGTFVGGRPVRHARLMSGDRVQIGSEHTFRFAILDEEEETLQRNLYESSTRDVLTGLMNRGRLFECLASALDRRKRKRAREATDVAFLFIDADHFKSVNDRFGHGAGDEVLKAISLAGRRVLDEGDVFARYGGEEFAVLLSPTGRERAVELAERIRRAVADLRVEVGAGAIAVTVSIGVALLSECEIVDGLELFTRADARLYAAKLGGRNRVCTVGG